MTADHSSYEGIARQRRGTSQNRISGSTSTPYKSAMHRTMYVSDAMGKRPECRRKPIP